MKRLVALLAISLLACAQSLPFPGPGKGATVGGGGLTPSYDTVTMSFSGNTGTTAFPFGSNIPAGDTAVVDILVVGTGCSASAVADDCGHSFTQIADGAVVSSSLGGVIQQWHYLNHPGGCAQIDITWSGCSINSARVQGETIKNLNSNLVDAHAINNGGDVTPVVPSSATFSTAHAVEVIHAYCGSNNGTTTAGTIGGSSATLGVCTDSECSEHLIVSSTQTNIQANYGGGNSGGYGCVMESFY